MYYFFTTKSHIQYAINFKMIFWGILPLFICCQCQTSKNLNSNKNDNNLKYQQWSGAADSCTYILIDQFLDKEKGIFGAGVGGALPNRTKYLYWQQAHIMDVIVYSYSRIKDLNKSKTIEYENYFKLWMQNHANNWYNWKSHGDTTGFFNEMVDDMAWITLTMLHISEATGDSSYYTMAKNIYDNLIIPQANKDEKGWAFPWKIMGKDNGRYICTNAPICVTACKLYMKTGNKLYLNNAISLYNFIVNNLLMADGRLEEPPLTYTQGTFAEAARLLYHITGKKGYLEKAIQAIKYTITSERCVDRGLLRHEGDDDDQGIFKAVFIPYAVNLAIDKSVPRNTREEIKAFLLFNAETLWYKHMNRGDWPKMYVGFYWGETYSVENDKNKTAYVCAQASGASLLENVARMLIGTEE